MELIKGGPIYFFYQWNVKYVLNDNIIAVCMGFGHNTTKCSQLGMCAEFKATCPHTIDNQWLVGDDLSV